jgi:hypothetical protein
MGRPNEYNVDAVRRVTSCTAPRCSLTRPPQVPKFIMANGKMVQMLIHTDVARAPRAGCGCTRERSRCDALRSGQVP